MAPVVLAALVARAVKLRVPLGDVLHEGVKKRREKLVFIVLGDGVDLAAVQGCVRQVVIEDAAHLAQNAGGEGMGRAVHDKRRDRKPGLAHRLDPLRRILVIEHHRGDFGEVRLIQTDRLALREDVAPQILINRNLHLLHRQRRRPRGHLSCQQKAPSLLQVKLFSGSLARTARLFPVNRQNPPPRAA